MTHQTVVIGAGVVGTAIAYGLVKRGAAVTLVDRDEPGRGASFGNSGAISEGSIAPLAMPGILKSVPGMLLDSESPLFLPLGYLPRAFPWLARFIAASRIERVKESSQRLGELHRGALAAHEAMTREIGVPGLFLRRGHLHLYPDEQALSKDSMGWRMRVDHGFAIDRLDRDGILELEPLVPSSYRVGMYMADHATIRNPFRYVQAMAKAFVSRGGMVVRDEVRALAQTINGWRVEGVQSLREASHVVVAGGAWSRSLLDRLGLRLPIESQRGYHVQFLGGQDIVSRTVVFADRKIFITPMENGLRVGGTVEIAGLQRKPDYRRAMILERIARASFPQLSSLTAEHWMGHRPCMPDSVPVVGQARGRHGLWLAVGHGHLGLTDSLSTARIIADGIFGEQPMTIAGV